MRGYGVALAADTNAKFGGSSLSLADPGVPHPCVIHIAIRRKNGSDRDERVAFGESPEVKSLESHVAGPDVVEFGTVGPWVQIPGPRPTSELVSAAKLSMQTGLRVCGELSTLRRTRSKG